MIYAIYGRISTDEQVKHSFSIATQKQLLNEYAEENNLDVYGEYFDEGVSGSTANRPQLNRLLKDVEDKKINCILFTRLDRWFRSVAEYYEIQKILERNDCSWKCTTEEYETVSSSGKFKVNIMLSVSQQYRDTQSEKIKESLDVKVRNGFYPSGATPLGFALKKVEGGSKLVIDESTRYIIDEFIEDFRITNSLRKSMGNVNDKYSLQISYKQYYKTFMSDLLHGEYNGFEDFCEGYISKEEHLRFLDIVKNKNVKANAKHDYIFSGLMKCPSCGNKLSGSKSYHYYKDVRTAFYTYRCQNNKLHKACTFKKALTEKRVERFVYDALRPQLEDYVLRVEAKQKQIKPKTDTSKLKTKLARLNRMYLDERISDEDYDIEYKDIQKKLALAEEEVVDVSKFKEVLELNIGELYSTLTNAEKRIFYRTILNEIVIDNDYNVELIFA